MHKGLAMVCGPTVVSWRTLGGQLSAQAVLFVHTNCMNLEKESTESNPAYIIFSIAEKIGQGRAQNSGKR